MTNERRVEKALAEASRARRRLSLADVVNAGLPAVYQQYGEQLVYLDGTIFDASDPRALTATPILVVDEADKAVGLEFGWRHAGDCSCRFCSNDRLVQRRTPQHAAMTNAWRGREASA